MWGERGLNYLSDLALSEINNILFIAFGIWFTLICFFKMAENAIRIVLSDDPNNENESLRIYHENGYSEKRKRRI